MAEPNPHDGKQQEAHANTAREKAIKGTGGPQVLSWPVDPDGNPMNIVMATAADLIPTVAFGNVTLQATIMRPVVQGVALTDEELAPDIDNARRVLKAAEYVVGTERRLVQWALDPASRIVNPATGEEFTGAGEAAGGAPIPAPTTPGPAPTPPVAGAPATQGDGNAQLG
jgi:hypothetical protein